MEGLNILLNVVKMSELKTALSLRPGVYAWMLLPLTGQPEMGNEDIVKLVVAVAPLLGYTEKP